MLAIKLDRSTTAATWRPGLAYPVGLWYFLYLFTSAGNYLLGLDGNGLTVSANAIVMGWAIWVAVFHRTSSKVVPCFIDVLVAMLVLLVGIHHLLTLGLTVAGISIMVNIGLAYWVSRRLFASEAADLLKVFALCGSAVLTMALINLPFVWASWRMEPGRPMILGSRANTVIMACYVGLFAVQLVAQMQRPVSGRRKVFGTLGLLCAAMIVLVAFSGKTSVIAASAIGSALLLFSKWSAKSIRMGWLFCFLGAGAVAFIAAPDKLINFYAYADISGMIDATSAPLSAYDNDGEAGEAGESAVDDSNTMAIRIVHIRDGFGAFRDNILFGYGPGKKRLPHSTVLQMFFEYGIVAGLIFSGIIAAMIWQLVRVAYDDRAGLRNEAWILLGLYLYVVLYDQVLGSIANLAQLFLLTGAAVSLTSAAARVRRRAVGAASFGSTLAGGAAGETAV